MADPEPSELDASRSSLVAGTLVENHREFLRFLEKRVGNRALAEDILQDAFARGLAQLDTLRVDESALAWFYRLLRNAVIDHWRREGAKERALHTFANEVEGRAEADGELKSVLCRCIGQLATTLKPEYADALRLIELEGLQVKEFAARIGISESNAAVRAFRAREALRKQLTRSCGTCAEHGCLDCTCSPAAGHCA